MGVSVFDLKGEPALRRCRMCPVIQKSIRHRLQRIILNFQRSGTLDAIGLRGGFNVCLRPAKRDLRSVRILCSVLEKPICRRKWIFATMKSLWRKVSDRSCLINLSTRKFPPGKRSGHRILSVTSLNNGVAIECTLRFRSKLL